MGSQQRFLVTTALGAALLVAAVGSSMAGVTGMTRASVDASAAQANGASSNSVITPDGRYVAFQSAASNLVSGDTNGLTDIFRKDLVTGDVVRASLANDGSQANGGSSQPSISDDGRFVAFQSGANNLVTGDTNGSTDVFIRDLVNNTTQVCTVSSTGVLADFGGEQGFVSGDGNKVIFLSSSSNMIPSDTSRAWNIYMWHSNTLTTERVSLTSTGGFINAAPRNATCSVDGRFVTFQSSATNVVPGDTNGVGDIFVRDRQLATTERVSVATGGTQSNNVSEFPFISEDGRYVAFHSFASNLVSGDTNGNIDVFVHDRQTTTTTRVSVSSGGVQGNGISWNADISPNGRFVAFESLANNLVPGDGNGQQDIFLHDRVLGTTEVVSATAGGVFGNGASNRPALDNAATKVAFHSAASNLVSGDSNGATDIFVADIAIPAPAAPSNLVATTLTSTSIQLDWTDNSPDETGFRVERRVGMAAFATVANLGANVTTFTNTGLTANTTYDYRVFAVNVAGDSPASNTASATTNPLGAPSGLTAAAFNSFRVDLAWVDNATGEDGFDIFASQDGGPFSQIGTAARNARTFRHSSAVPNSTWQYRVRAFFNATSQVTDLSNTATSIVPGQILGLTGRALHSTRIRIQYNDFSTNETGIEIWRKDGAGAFALLRTSPANTLAFNDTVAPEETFRYKVRAKNGTKDFGSFSNELEAYSLHPPTNLVATVMSSTRIDMTWTENSSLEDAVEVHRRLGTGSFKRIAYLPANTTSFSDTTVLPNRTYGYQVRVARGINWSSFSNIESKTTPP
jgi:hypothetical protein